MNLDSTGYKVAVVPPLTDEEKASAVRRDLQADLKKIVDSLNNVKKVHGFNVDFNLQRGMDGMFLPEAQIRITKDL